MNLTRLIGIMQDRRPITPPPAVRLTIRDAATGNEVDPKYVCLLFSANYSSHYFPSEIDTSYFVLTVDLWSADGTREVNLVRHSATSPSISASTATSFPPPPPPQQRPYPTATPPYYNETYGQRMHPATGNYIDHNSYYPPTQQPPPQQPTGGMFTRNLIGSLSASAFRLTDPDDRIGVWFILQDLSVRTEGMFR